MNNIREKMENCRDNHDFPAISDEKSAYGAPAGAGLGIIEVVGVGPAGALAPNF